jgi:hypothetical protein
MWLGRSSDAQSFHCPACGVISFSKKVFASGVDDTQAAIRLCHMFQCATFGTMFALDAAAGREI